MSWAHGRQRWTLRSSRLRRLPEGGPWLGSMGVKSIHSSLVSTQSLVASKLPQSSCPRGLEEPRGGPAGATGSGETLLLQEHHGACPRTLLSRERWRCGLAPAFWCAFSSSRPVLCPPASSPSRGPCQPKAGEGSGLSDGPEARELSRPQTCWVYNRLMSPPLSCESSGRPAGLRPPLRRTGLDRGCQGPQRQPCRLPRGWTDGGTRSHQLGSLEGIRAALGEGMQPQIFQTTA